MPDKFGGNAPDRPVFLVIEQKRRADSVFGRRGRAFFVGGCQVASLRFDDFRPSARIDLFEPIRDALLGIVKGRPAWVAVRS